MPTSTAAPTTSVPPLTEPIAIAVSRLVDDHGASRQPSHWDVGQAIKRAGLVHVDPGQQTSVPVGKYKRVQQVLLWAVEHDVPAGRRLVGFLVSAVRGCGGFRSNSDNFAGAEAIANLKAVFDTEGWLLTDDGQLHRHLLDDDELGTKSAGDVLRIYARRANQGANDAALVTSTGKDLVEAVAAHVLVKHYGTYSVQSFPQLLGMAFTTLGLEATNASTPQGKIELGLYSTACAVNQLRNKQGTGHGRPFLSTVTVAQARVAIRSMGVVADLLLGKLNEQAS